MNPVAVLAFGVALATAATFILARYANPLTAVLALGGFYFYVFIYTRWLKRSTPQNIVIGGAAGAFPPLVGWAAVTGGVDLTAFHLFAIVFFWTPPHFWALALVKQHDYGRAGVPMAPLVWGERDTLDEMLRYAVVLVPLTLLPVSLGALGTWYLVAAVALGAVFLTLLVQLRQKSGSTRHAWRTYRFSLVYLALLFIAMAADRAIAR
jgi:protoheme IX farnesyltransferase